MPNPIWITSENVKFNGTLDNAAVLDTVGNIRSLILWDDLSAADQSALTDFIDDHGGALPLAGPTAGFQRVSFPTAVVGGDATGLNNVATATNGVATIDYNGSVVGGNQSGLSSAAGTQGSRVVNFLPTLTGGTSTGLGLTAGYQVATFSVAKAGGDATGLTNDATAYTTTITVDGVAKSISVVGSAAQTFTALLSEINTDLGASATATLDAGNIKITSATTGVTSTVLTVTGTLFPALTNFAAITAAVPGTGSVAALTATITVDSVAKAISILPAAIPTFADLVNEINVDLGASAVASISGGDIKITSATSGISSTVSIAPGTLFPALVGYSSVLPPQNGDSAVRTYSATVVVDGVIKTVSFAGAVGATFTDVIAEINADLGVAATAAIAGGNITITSATTGNQSSVVIYDSGFLFSSMAGYVGISTTNGTSPVNYNANIVVDGTVIPISVQGSTAQTFTTLLAEINTDLGASATATISNGKMVVTSATTGTNSSVRIVDLGLFKTIKGAKETPVVGVVNLVAAAKNTRSKNGGSLFGEFNVLYVGTKPVVLPNTTKSIDYVYWNGTVWKYLLDDTDV